MSAMSTSRWMTVRATRGTYRIMHTHTHLGKYGPNMLRRVIAHPVHMLERYVRSLAIARSQANLDRGHDMLYLHRGKWTIVDHVERRLWWLQSTLEDIAMYITWDTPEPDIPRFTAGIVRRVPVTTHCEQFAEWNADTEFVHGSFLYPENASGLCECEVCVYVRKVNYLKRHGVAR